MSSKKVKINISIIIAVYLFLAIAGSYTKKGEITPFFNWSLFSSVRGELLSYNMFVKLNNEWVNIQKSDVLKNESDKITFYFVTRKLGSDLLWSRGKISDQRFTEIQSFLPDGLPFYVQAEYYSPLLKYRGKKSELIPLSKVFKNNSILDSIRFEKLTKEYKTIDEKKFKIKSLKFVEDKFVLKAFVKMSTLDCPIYLSDGERFLNYNLNRKIFDEWLNKRRKGIASFDITICVEDIIGNFENFENIQIIQIPVR